MCALPSPSGMQMGVVDTGSRTGMSEADSRTESRPAWERRFWCPRVGLVRWARDAPDRGVTIATVEGTIEVHCWDGATGRLSRVTRRPAGTHRGKLDPSGAWVWWFDDTTG